jgi:23S rRNA (guanosine2251-2'-O)-methyltransferase
MIVFGKQVVLYILDRHPDLIEEIYLTKEIDKKLFNKFAKLNKKIVKPEFKQAQALAKGGNHQGFLLKIKDIEFCEVDRLKREDFIIILSSLSDVGNIGAIIRTAYALGVGGVIISGLKSINLEAIIRSSAGAAIDLPIAFYKDTLTLLNELGQIGFERVVADMSGEDIREVNFSQKRVLIVGSEGDGIPRKILKICDKVVKIKMQREFDSLNVSVATAILCDRMR